MQPSYDELTTKSPGSNAGWSGNARRGSTQSRFAKGVFAISMKTARAPAVGEDRGGVQSDDIGGSGSGFAVIQVANSPIGTLDIAT